MLLRHAKSSWKFEHPDHDRPLAERGRRDGVAAGRVLADVDLAVVHCSTATRARETWRRAQLGGAACDDVHYDESVYSATAAQLLTFVKTLPDAATTALVIGHEPTLSSLILLLSEPNDLTERVAEKFPTSAIATLELTGDWGDAAPAEMRLTQFTIPRG